MMVETFDVLGEGVEIAENVQAEKSTDFESTELNNFENKKGVSEVDEARINETSEVLADVFTADVIANWSEMSIEERTAKINEYYIKAGEKLGIDTKGVIVEPMPSQTPGSINLGYNSGDGYIHINQDVMANPDMLGQVIDTATHEMRHQFQSDVIENPERFPDIPKEVLDTWRYELDPNNYINPDYDPQGYYKQEVECDARDFSADVMTSYMEKMNLN